MSPLRATGFVLALSGATLLAGCAGSTGFSALDRPQTSEDELPATFLSGLETDAYDPATSRFAGTSDGVDYFMIEPRSSAGKGTPCLAVVGDAPVIACGGNGEVTTGSSFGDDAQLVREPAVSGDGWTAISDNVRVKPKD